jgi:hypothetical protein
MAPGLTIHAPRAAGRVRGGGWANEPTPSHAARHGPPSANGGPFLVVRNPMATLPASITPEGDRRQKKDADKRMSFGVES